ncbi:hypothetical protein DICVIV_13122 [Dictyocaulus viviparus]|uniref:G-protein coupled receptors family 1 profile domain-containing protein n=1 Tax=Dictyocaulus viviparus TaxID=29172 RepID=A0A0D8XB87_DICVI|nr:hypothetical protein DICVIV_13122 [Dictyocaulus viviparus]
MVNLFLDCQEKEKQRLALQNRRTTCILVAMVAWFGLTWLPHNVLSLIIEYDESQTFFRLFGREELDISYLLNLFTHCFAMSNNVVNPLLYAWLNPVFQQLVIKTIFTSMRKKRSRNLDTLTEHRQRKFTPYLRIGEMKMTQSSSFLEANHSTKRSRDIYGVQNDSTGLSACNNPQLVDFDENDVIV